MQRLTQLRLTSNTENSAVKGIKCGYRTNTQGTNSYTFKIVINSCKYFLYLGNIMICMIPKLLCDQSKAIKHKLLLWCVQLGVFHCDYPIKQSFIHHSFCKTHVQIHAVLYVIVFLFIRIHLCHTPFFTDVMICFGSANWYYWLTMLQPSPCIDELEMEKGNN